MNKGCEDIAVTKLKGEIKKLNKVRGQHGKIPVYVPYGDPLF